MKSQASRKLSGGWIAAGLAAAVVTTWISVDIALSQVTTPGGAGATPGRNPAPIPTPPVAVTPYGPPTVFYSPNTPATTGYRYEAVSPEQAQKVAEIDQKTRELLGKYSATEDADEKSKVIGQLTAAVGEQFDARQEVRQQELKRLEEQLKKLKALHDRRVAEKSQIIEDRVRQLLRDADGLGWGADEHQGGWFTTPVQADPGAQPGVRFIQPAAR